MREFKLLLADPKGQVIEHPWLLATLRSDETLLPPRGRPIPLPPAAKLAHLPGRVPVGVDPQSGALVPVAEFQMNGRAFRPHAVAAVLPPGYTRTFLPGELKGDGPILSQWAYTAAAWSEAGPVVWAIHTDRRKHWTPARFDPTEAKKLVKEHTARFPDNEILKQLKTCALVYRCFTSQNIFYARDEGALPVSVMCNARCVGCISDQPEDGPPASHARMDHGPTAEEMADIGSYHLEHAPGRTMISFGQGCEGEPLTRWKAIAKSIELIRARTQRGSININTNASLTNGLEALYDAGLDSIRVSLNSASKDLYEAYYKPQRYGWEDVERSIALSAKKKAYIALNLLLFPGVSDRAGEVDALLRLVKKYRIHQIQTRPLAIDPTQYIEIARGKGAGGEAMGVSSMLALLKTQAPWLVIGNFARGLGERRR
jgi:wyosine [tRNA(Phe)-imidazoG37] synthetase (radical SAM superfamily)